MQAANPDYGGDNFQDTHLPLQTWFKAIWWVGSHKYDASASTLQKLLKVSYKTAWTLLRKLQQVRGGVTTGVCSTQWWSFRRLIKQAVITEPVTFAEITKRH